MTQHVISPAGPSGAADKDAPVLAPRPLSRPVTRILFGDAVQAPYRWLRDRRSAEVAAHFAAENAYTDRRTAHLATLRDSLEAAIETSSPETAPSAPVFADGWWYIDRTSADEGATLSRVKDRAGLVGATGVPEVTAGTLLEGEQILARNCQEIIGFAVSPDLRLLARAEVGFGGCHLIISELETGEVVDQVVHGAGPDLVFSADSTTLLYTDLDDLGRRHQVRSHQLGTPTAEDAVLLEEPDHWAQLELSRSRDGSALLVHSSSLVESETWVADLAAPGTSLHSVTGRQSGQRRQVEHAGDRLLLLHEDADSRRSVLSETGLDAHDDLTDAHPLLTARDGEHFVSVEAFADFAALQVRIGGLPAVRVVPRRADGSFDVQGVHEVGRGGELDSVHIGMNPDWHQRTLRCRLDSFLTPSTVLQHDLGTRESTVLLQQSLPGFDPQRYVEHRLWASSADGTAVPISLFARRDVPVDGTAACMLYGDGAYGASIDPVLQHEALTLADRGVVIAIAHVRGGGELGPDWHRQGRHLHKDNSFDDFVACAEHLVATGWTSPDRLGAVGTGAGGLLVAVAANRAPHLFRAVLAGTPLVDPLETLLDKDVMLTIEEWAEWGDPAGDESTYRALRGFSPAENVRAVDYPAIYAWTALEGTDTPPACAAIWVAQLRDQVTSDPVERPILLRTTATPGAAGDPRVEGVAWLLDQLDAVTLGE